MAHRPRASASATTVVAALGATLLVVLLATWAASIGPDDVFRGDGLPRRTTVDDAPSEPAESRSSDATSEPAEREQEEPPRWVAVAAALVQVAVVVALLYLLYRAARWTRRLRIERRPRTPPEPEIPFDVLEEPRRVVEAMVADATDQRAALLEGTPRNAIVACWHRFETQASSVGLAREPWETSSEFTLRLLDLVSADPAAVGELAGLYREARFSDHELGEAGRDRALAALDSLHRQLGSRMAGR